ncbi:MAG TPA: DUF4864 domain-containing protein [Candidatus Acidoferrales bacterium]|nr:DUF4864 domain-containing protein [Candidatus Acidoferrales bacterium]
MEEPLNDGTIPGEPQGEPESVLPEPVLPPWQPAFERERSRRRALLRRLAGLMGTGTLAFTFTTWLLLRHEIRTPRPGLPAAASARAGQAAKEPPPASDEAAEAAALREARAQLEALNQDDISGAYGHFSARYRARVPLATFRKLVTAHRDMFHTEEQDVKTRSKTDERVVLDIHVSSDDDGDYVAQFTLVRLGGRWCVDDLRWAFDESDTHSSA